MSYMVLNYCLRNMLNNLEYCLTSVESTGENDIFQEPFLTRCDL